MTSRLPRSGQKGGVVVSSRWTAEQTVNAFVGGTPNQVLMSHAQRWLDTAPGGRVLDLGCGAARNAAPLAELGFRVTGIDLSEPMLRAAAVVAARSGAPERLDFVHCGMTPLPFEDNTFDAVIAHGIWNLATTDDRLRAAIGEAARVAKSGAPLFVFTFSRNTLPADVSPVAGERFIFTQFAGEPQCFLTRDQLESELRNGGWERRPDGHLVEYNAPRPGGLRSGGPVLYEGVFHRA